MAASDPPSVGDEPEPTSPPLPSPNPQSERRITGLGRAAAWRYANLGASSLEGLFVAGFALRQLGTADYGVYALAAATIALVGTVDFGLSLSVMRSVARDSEGFAPDERRRARKDAAAAHTVYALCGGVTVLFTGAILWVLPRIAHHGSSTTQDRLTILLVGLSIALSLGTSAFDGVPSGRKNFAIPAIATIAGAVANVVIVVTTIQNLHIVALGLGQLCGVVITRLVGAWWLLLHERWFRLLPAKATREQIRTVVAFAAPLLILSVGAQAIAATDLLVVGALVSASAVALYRVGFMAPNQTSSLLFTGVDAAFPSLAGNASNDSQEDAIGFLTRLLSYIAGLVFGLLIILRNDVVTLIVGHPSPLASSVLVVFSCIWLANVPVHGLALLLIARGRQRTFTTLVAVEAVANIALTIPFVWWFGAIGAAFATLITIVVSNDVVLPLIVRRDFQFSPHRMVWRESVPLILLGGVIATISTIPVVAESRGIVQIVTGFVICALLGSGAGYLLLGRVGRQALVQLLRATNEQTKMNIQPSD